MSRRPRPHRPSSGPGWIYAVDRLGQFADIVKVGRTINPLDSRWSRSGLVIIQACSRQRISPDGEKGNWIKAWVSGDPLPLPIDRTAPRVWASASADIVANEAAVLATLSEYLHSGREWFHRVAIVHVLATIAGVTGNEPQEFRHE